jgi:uncharacterized protein
VKAALLTLGLLLAGSLAPVQAQVDLPTLEARVTDLTGTLTAQQQSALEEKLAAFERRKGAQLVVLIMPTTQPEDIAQFGIRLAEAWKVGREKPDDGAIFIIARDDREMRIEVGRGLEGALTDVTSSRILNDTVVPLFRAGDLAGGINAGVDQIIRVVDGEPLPAPQPATAADERGDIVAYIPMVFAVAVVLGTLLRALLGRLPGALATGGVVAVGVFVMAGVLSLALSAGLIALLVSLFGGWGLLRMGRGAGGRGSGSGGLRGGGGGFGGGGASGRW